MPRFAAIPAALLAILAAGCATPVVAPRGPNTVIVVPGIGGDGGVYAQVVHALQDAGSRDCLCVFNWGCSWALFPITLSSSGLHHDTERRLAQHVIQWRKDHPGSRIVLVGHSAGAGVIVGMLGRLDDSTTVGPVILLAPALSPDFDLRPALDHVTCIHVFYSGGDWFWQGIGSTIFGGYDGVHRDGAGRKGFSLVQLSDDQKRKVVQHPWQPQWKDLGEDGGHFDWMSEPFVAKVLAPLIDDTGQSSAASRP
jgi:pimeloyl-ACP methyl ester carboxylesterase